MGCGKCGSGCKKVACLCPISFGLALGITCFIAVLVCYAYMMMYGVPASWAHMVEEPITWGMAFAKGGWCFLKGLVFGFVLVVIYDCIVCCGKKLCRKGDDNCGPNCNCSCHRK